MNISGAEYVIQKIGGVTKTAHLIGKPITTVQSWKNRDLIPQKHWNRIIDSANNVGIEFTPLDFFQSHTIADHATSHRGSAA